MRYGISALSTDYHNVAEPDELMVQIFDGKMYYKREDGQIVTASRDYDRKTLLSDLVASGIKLNLKSTEYICYNTVDISGGAHLQSTDEFDPKVDGVTFPVINGKSGVCIRVRGTDMVNAITTYLRNFYTSLGGKEKKIPEVQVTLVVNGTEIQAGLNFNQLGYIDLQTEEATSFYIKSISFPRFEKYFAYLSTHRIGILSKLNMDNETFEASIMDVVTLNTDVTKVPIFELNGKCQLKMMFPMEAVVEEASSALGDSSGITMSDEQPDFPCIWAKPRNVD